MSFKEQDKQMVKELEKRGLGRVVKHVIHEMPEEIREGVLIYGHTSVGLFPLNERGDMNEDVFLGAGLARCSSKDQFCRAKGRVIATGRALKDNENYADRNPGQRPKGRIPGGS